MNNLAVYQDKFAAGGFRVFQRAIEESRRRNQNYVSLGHLLVALGAEDGGAFRQQLKKLRALHNLETELMPEDEAIEKILDWSPKYKGKGIRIGPETILFLRRAMNIARSNRREKIEAADLLTAFLQLAPIVYVRPDQTVSL